MSNDTRSFGRANEAVTGNVADDQRDASIDVARGIAIIAIVLGHVLRGLDAAHLMDHVGWAPAADRILYLWHLSIFAFVGGVFVAKSVSKRPLRSYVGERTFKFLTVYLLWTVLQGAVLLGAARVVNNPRPLSSLLRVWAPSGQLWYLPFLAVLTLLVVPLKPWRRERAPWLLGLAAVLSVAMWGFDGGIVGTQGLGLVVFFVGGAIIGVDRLRPALRSIPTVVAAAGGIGLFALGMVAAICADPTPPTTGWEGRTASSVALGVALSILMSAAVLLVARAARSWNFLAFCGRRSLDIYLAHIILASGSRIVLVKFGVHSLELLIAVGLAAGVLGSLVVATAIRNTGLAWVFDGPAPPAWPSKRGARSRP
ncbi:acyltransferase family protein [Mycobacterium parmense]|uniref:Uncharacterized protein n=1 Tax=Mycobacterium parmense TaxID=185642 RepID=A0A7I7Z1Z5_9MYCO|nr:acyltransferase [Mycobacterium parmense]MCV7352086.1 acyltransferase [Mycobacterium parmense]ORW56091.1 hypothetical protein AWC20_15260 [Mycobacterium parmense]BBZ48198.1 hypothetical protein MPRM_54790 [Mycobacterium parmense]